MYEKLERLIVEDKPVVSCHHYAKLVLLLLLNEPTHAADMIHQSL